MADHKSQRLGADPNETPRSTSPVTASDESGSSPFFTPDDQSTADASDVNAEADTYDAYYTPDDHSNANTTDTAVAADVERPAAYYISDSHLHGNGLFANRPFAVGELIATFPSLLFIQWRRDTTKRPPLSGICDTIAEFDDTKLNEIVCIMARNPAGVMPSDQLAYMRSQFKERQGEGSWGEKSVAKVMKRGIFPPPELRWNGFVHVSKDASLLNHSCLPNVVATQDQDKKEVYLSSTREIGKGEELTISYCNIWRVREERHRRLGFVCGCEECPLEGQWLRQSNNIYKRVGGWLKEVTRFREACKVKQEQVFEVAEADTKDFVHGREETIKRVRTCARKAAEEEEVMKAPSPERFLA
ncbi:uncharacterized protein LTR77_004786 [Saxophila tyrrhenica]|uniref:SET domain-containing protein n=1 Tax=Saxophila tyrrhenica TaxID=1690608 RepID=A0AAV9PAS2_9PEZI|nr:hypothetical protein LTR77_004786 [Saxophila tyrrhenica]